jgi:cell division protein FtsI/penicillin-binding protein 2
MLHHFVHTFPVWVYWITRWAAIGAALFAAGLFASAAAGAQSWQAAADLAGQNAPQARIAVLDVAANRLLAVRHLDEAAHTLAAPGSTLKPLALYGLIAEGRWNPEQRVACNRQLVIAGHRLACTHPLSPPFDAQEALAWSCNSYFAAVARNLQPAELGRLLRPTGLLGPAGLNRNEAVAEFREPHSAEATQLALLGVEGVRVTPLELAEAYRWLAREMAAHPDSDASQVVSAGLQDSASFGMAGQADLGGVAVAGKTGTAEGETTSQTHGWFVGLAPAANPQAVLVVYVPSGRGADAAHVAGELLAHSALRRR